MKVIALLRCGIGGEGLVPLARLLSPFPLSRLKTSGRPPRNAGRTLLVLWIVLTVATFTCWKTRLSRVSACFSRSWKHWVGSSDICLLVGFAVKAEWRLQTDWGVLSLAQAFRAFQTAPRPDLGTATPREVLGCWSASRGCRRCLASCCQARANLAEKDLVPILGAEITKLGTRSGSSAFGVRFCQ
eukprot:4517712-Pyramimonas_sp.AAC.1